MSTETEWEDEMAETVQVEVGQVWVSCDKRDDGRQVQVLAVHTQMADGTRFLHPYAVVKSPTGLGRKSSIRLDRFRPTANGYRLVRDAR